MFRHYKGIHELLQAVRKVPNTPLVMIGEGLLYERARKWVGEMGLEGRVFLLGRRSDEEVRLHLHACLFLVLPSTNRAEAFGLALLEAMACGKPVISTELGTGTSVVNLNGRTGLVVPPGDVEALRLALNALVTDRGLRERMGEEARRRVAEEFCQEKMIRQYLRVYEELLSARQGAS
jgi:rhamnosyl/mannosyltransferase